MEEERQVGNIATGLGIVFGGGFGMVTATIAGADITTGIAFGPSWGIITGAMIGVAVERKKVRMENLSKAGAVIGSLTGACIGLVMAWSHSLQYLGSITGGSLGGLLGGGLIGYMTESYKGNKETGKN